MVAAAGVVGGLVTAAGAAVGLYAWNNTTYADRALSATRRAGFVEHEHTLPNGVRLNYAEGPARGPALLLVHGQGSSWESYAPVLPALAREFHVFALDVPGHGSSSRTPGRYDVHHIGADVATFVDEVIGEPVLLAGHSSGGLIAAWIAANRPEQVTAVLFEDPPFFSTEPDRMPWQFNYVDLARPAHEFLRQSTETDFVAWYLERNAWIRYFDRGRDGIVRSARRYRAAHPDAPLNLWFLPPSVNRSFEFLHEFDPAFADAFYTLDWQRDFDQHATLARVRTPATLVHANWRVAGHGILEGAMTADDAARARATIRDCRLERVDTGHGFHAEKPRLFVDLTRQLRDRAPVMPGR